MSGSNSDSRIHRNHRDVEDLLREVSAIRADMISGPATLQQLLQRTHPNYRDSARNLLHYLALRRHDLRPLQFRLASLGLSSLGRAESHVLATVDAVLEALHHLAGRAWRPPAPEQQRVDFATGQRLLAEHTEALLGPATPGRDVRIMVTMPTEAGEDYTLVQALLKRGMDCMRINCAHDDPATWRHMIEHLRRAERALGRSCRVVMDLAGPKLRTGPIEPGPAVVRIRPRRDPLGRVTAPARVWLADQGSRHPPPSPADACLPLPPAWLSRLRPDDRVTLTDARNSRRIFTVTAVSDRGCWAEANKTTYVIPGTTLHQERAGEARIGDLPPHRNAICLRQGDRLVITRGMEPGRAAVTDSAGKLLTPARIGCTIPGVFDDVRAGDNIWFDDGRIGGVVEKIEIDRALIHITHAHPGGAKLRADKGINLPDSPLQLPALTARDLEDLAFVARHADVVQLSFANSARDVELLQQQLEQLGGRQPAVVLKIETRRGFESLPDMLLTAMRAPRCGVMIARGDLAVECGFERLAEVQEEILWICEAAHVPVIWATQVLESLAKVGIPSRAEITDAAMGHRAECVMLNKGPHIVSAVQVLDDILRRMQAHQAKKQSMLRELHLAHRLPTDRRND
ncbi:pyruvate kinase [Microbulbifer taiwanensis]|uniref:pyruvate kinase n=1 Tax=Microbulbifer taiwanensis TaxID=986746 RepID=A0ABW1YV94_9GAMM|nr:pyruvate kinase [Microbulbifer taiwanensis]